MKRLIPLAGLMLSACATIGTDFDPVAVEAIPMGTPQAQVIAQLGAPTARTRLADGSTHLLWSYGRGTAFGGSTGKAVMLQFDSAGRYTGIVSSSQTTVR